MTRTHVLELLAGSEPMGMRKRGGGSDVGTSGCSERRQAVSVCVCLHCIARHHTLLHVEAYVFWRRRCNTERHTTSINMKALNTKANKQANNNNNNDNNNSNKCSEDGATAERHTTWINIKALNTKANKQQKQTTTKTNKQTTTKQTNKQQQY